MMKVGAGTGLAAGAVPPAWVANTRETRKEDGSSMKTSGKGWDEELKV
jgi:hypothetical protein